MTTTRLEAFSDGVFAILITIMVLELGKPKTPTWHDLKEALPHIGIYALSFVTLGIYWANHHHMFHVVDRVNGAVLWTNLNLLFWISLIPYMTAWLGDEGLKPVPATAYGAALFASSFSFFFLNTALIRANGRDSRCAKVLGDDSKGKLSTAIYVVAIPLAYFWPPAGMALYVITAALWFVPDRRMEN